MRIRRIMLCLTTIILGIIGLSQVEEIFEDIQFPARYGVRLTYRDGEIQNINSDDVYRVIKEGSKENKQQIFRKYIDDNGEEAKFSFSNEKKVLDEYSTDISVLKEVSFQAMYYSDKPITNKMIKNLNQMNIEVKTSEINWFLSGFAFWTSGIQAIGLWCLMFTMFFGYFSILNFYKKESYIYRFLGISTNKSINHLVRDVSITLVSSLSLLLVYIGISGNPLDSLGTLAYVSILGTNEFILVTLVIFAIIIYNISIKYGNILVSLRGKTKNFIINMIWFLGILGTISILPIILNQIDNNQDILKEQVNNLEPWEQLKDYKTVAINFPGISSIGSNNSRMNISEDLKFGKRFMSYFNKDDYIFTQKSHVVIPDKVSENTKEEISEQYEMDGIDYKIAENVIYMNKKAYILSCDLLKERSVVLENYPAFIILPEKYLSGIDSVVNATYMEFFQNSDITREMFGKKIISDGIKTFLFDYKGADLYGFDKSRKQSSYDKIIVILDMDKVLSTDAAITTYFNLNKALFSNEGIKKLSKDEEINKNLNGITNPYKAIKLKTNKLKKRIKGAIVSLLSLMCIQAFVLIQFFLNIARQNIRKISTMRILGFNLNGLILKVFSLYLVIIGWALIISYIFIINEYVREVLLLFNVFEISCILILMRNIIKNKTIRVLKGDNEI